MIIQCEECSTRFRLADEKLKSTGTKVRCSKCKHVFTVMPPEPEPAEEVPAPVEEQPVAAATEDVSAPEPSEETSTPEPTEDAPVSEPSEEPPASEPMDESIDFDAMNMEAVPLAPPAETTFSDDEAPQEETTLSAEAPAMDEEPSTREVELDFSGLEQEMATTAKGEGELADEFSFAPPEAESDADDEVAVDSDESTEEFSPDSDDASPEEVAVDMSADASDEFAFDAGSDATDEGDDEFALDETPDTADEFALDEGSDASAESADEFAFGEAPDTADEFVLDEGSDAVAESSDGFAFDETPDTADEFALDEGSTSLDDNSGEFSFGDEADATEEASKEFAFDEPELDTPTLQEEDSAAADDTFEVDGDDDAFAFDDAPALDTAPSSEEEPTSEQWGDDSSDDEDAFDFDEPAFETETAAPALGDDDTDGANDLQFGEIDLTQDDGDSAGSFDSGSDFAGATLETEEPSLDVPPPPKSQESFDDGMTDEPLPAPPVKRKKGPLARILLLLILLLLTLGGAAGYFYMQDGGLDINRIIERFTGGSQPAVQEHKIGINISGTSYVNNRTAGQLLVVQGTAVNNFSTARSAITIKGILLDAQGNTLFQQTVYCGNPLATGTLQEEPFETLETAMNNQFGDSLSNMNVAAGASIPFTIVFRNLPEGLDNIKAEVVTSKPGG